MRAPEFWYRDSLISQVLAPLGWAYDAAGRCRRRLVRPWRAPVPVICVGNLVAGGASKTPVALSLATLLAERGCGAHFLSRGYGGRLAGPVRVDAARHDAGAVGDEALLLAAEAPTWIARDRVAGAHAAVAAGAEAIIMDDGFQNPGLAQDLALIVVDPDVGFGNGRIIPAGPLRESVAAGLDRGDAVVVVGIDTAAMEAALGDAKPVLRARLVPLPSADRVAGARVVAFAGIGRPEKFFATLRGLGCTLVAGHGFADHHVYARHEIAAIVEQAAASGAVAVTTAKDAARLDRDSRALVEVLEVAVAWDDPAAVETLLDHALGGSGE